MRKYLLIAAFLTICHYFLSAQNPKSINSDSLKIDSLKRILPSLKDTARINCLNNIGEAFLDRNDYKFKRKVDSALVYAEIANHEATKTGYKYGIAKSLLEFCSGFKLYSFHNRNNRIDNAANFSKWGVYQKQLYDIAGQIEDAEIWGRTYSLQSDLFSWQKKEKESQEALKNAMKWFRKSGDEMNEAAICTVIGYTYSANGEYENAFEYFSRALQIGKKLSSNAGPVDFSTEELVNYGLMNMADMYVAAGDYESALNFIREGMQFDAKLNASNKWGLEEQLANLFLGSGQYDSAFYYLEPIIRKSPAPIFLWPSFADAFLLAGKQDSALYYYNRAIDSLKGRVFAGATEAGLMRCYIGKAKILNTQKKFGESLSYAKKSLTLEQYRSIKLAGLNTYKLISTLFYQLGKNDSAYIYLNKYMHLKDSLVTRQFIWRLNNYKKEADEAKKEARIGFLNRDNKIKEQQLKQEASFKKFLLVGLLLLFIASVFIVRTLLLKRKNDKLKNLQLKNELKLQQMENEKRQTEFQKKTTELEMQALRAQMNPHFIFNSLSSINRFILKNEPDTASDYLTRFSRLIRMVLMNSQKSLITLEDELDMLTIYLDMERLRFKNTFDYHIIFTNRVDAGSIYIPPLLLQPFCENAIWHGLKHLSDPQSGRDEHGKLDIILSMEDKVLNCSITDNGIGRQKAAEIRSKSAEEKKSMGLKITTERLALLNQQKENLTSFEIVDLKNENTDTTGTSVKLKISLTEPIEESA